jgi:hypothetical protein
MASPAAICGTLLLLQVRVAAGLPVVLNVLAQCAGGSPYSWQLCPHLCCNGSLQLLGLSNIVSRLVTYKL